METKPAGAGSPADARQRTRSGSAAVPVSALLALAGGGMQGYANGTIDALVILSFLMVVGYLVVRLIFPHGRAEHRAFLLAYSIGVFGGGLAQCYSLFKDGEVQSFVDAIGFYDAIFDRPPYYSWDEITSLWVDGKEVSRGAPLAVVIWQWVYHLRYKAGLSHGVYVGVMFNALVMGLTACITVRTAREAFGNDIWRLRRVGTLFALCGLFILFSSILIRDCFTTFLNSLVLWGIVRWLSRPNTRTLTFAGLITLVAIAAMYYLRSRSIALFGLYWALAGLCWFIAHRLDHRRMLAVTLSIPVLLFGSAYLLHYIQASRDLQAQHREQYESILAEASLEDSIAMRLIVKQPLPVRLALGTGSMAVFPIPLWSYFDGSRGEYHVIKGYHGLYQLAVMPFLLAGFVIVARGFLRDRRKSIALVYLTLYLTMNTLAVVATSLEQRHLAQFMPAFMLLAVVPDTRERATRAFVGRITAGWICVVILVHLAWAAMAMGR